MPAEHVGALVKYGISALIGLYITLLGYRVVGNRPGENLKYDVWFEKNGKWFRTIGPILIVGAFIMLAFRLSR